MKIYMLVDILLSGYMIFDNETKLNNKLNILKNFYKEHDIDYTEGVHYKVYEQIIK